MHIPTISLTIPSTNLPHLHTIPTSTLLSSHDIIKSDEKGDGKRRTNDRKTKTDKLQRYYVQFISGKSR